MNQYFIFKLIINFISVAILVILLHYKLYKKSEYIFTYVIFNSIIFMISYVLQNNEMSMGAAFGLFAVFSMIRYRTEDISTRDMTYLFIVIALGLLNAIHKEQDANGVIQLICYNGVLVFITIILESRLLIKRENIQIIQYQPLENIKPENKQILIEDIKMRTGLNAHRLEIGKIDFLKETAVVKVYYY